MIAIAGATGHIGSELTRILLSQGIPVRALGRDGRRLKPLVELGAEGCIGDMSETLFLYQAFKGVDGAFTLIPPAYQERDFRAYQNRIGESLAEALGKAGVARVVNLSSQGAHLPARTGPIMGLRDQEERLNEMGSTHVVHLRPSYFMENLMTGIPVIKSMGVNGSPLKADLPIPMIATRDIASAAARVLTSPPEPLRILDLLGPRDYTMAEATPILGRAIGKPSLAYIQLPYEDALKGMTGMGIFPDVAERMIEMMRSMNEGILMGAQIREAHNSTPTTMEQFAADFANAFLA